MSALVQTWHSQLMSVADEHKIQMQIVNKIRSAQLLVFRAQLSQTAHLKKVLKLEDEVGMALSVETPRISRNLGFVDFEILLPKLFRRSLPASALPQDTGMWATIGQTAVGQNVRLKLTGTRTCHTLIAGMTGSGKTVLEQFIAWIIASHNDPRDVRLILIDGKGGVKWFGFSNIPHLQMPIIGQAQDAVGALAWALAEMDKRKSTGQSHPQIFVIIDELRDLIGLAGDDIAVAMSRLTSMGREFGVHIIAATQKPLSDAVGGSIAKANFPLRLCGLVRSAQDAFIATGVPGTGAERLNGLGDFVLVAANMIHRVQVGLVGNREFGLLERSSEPAEMPELDLDLDLSHVLDVVSGNGASNEGEEASLESEMLAWALAHGTGAKKIRAQFGGAMSRASRVRKLALQVFEAWETMGYGKPIVMGGA